MGKEEGVGEAEEDQCALSRRMTQKEHGVKNPFKNRGINPFYGEENCRTKNMRGDFNMVQNVRFGR